MMRLTILPLDFPRRHFFLRTAVIFLFVLLAPLVAGAQLPSGTFKNLLETIGCVRAPAQQGGECADDQSIRAEISSNNRSFTMGRRLDFSAENSGAGGGVKAGLKSYSWRLAVPGGSFTELNQASEDAVYFEADTAAPYTLTLTVTDASGTTSEDQITFTPDLPLPDSLPAFTPTTAPPPELTDQKDAIRLLYQATFGPRVEDVAYLTDIGAKAWFEEQITMEPFGYLDAWAEIAEEFNDVDGTAQANGMELPHEAFMFNALESPDQLRQRMTYALSQLLVVSANFDFSHHDQLVQGYVDVLHTNAFGNYRDLLKSVTLHPAMGMYLAMLGNQKADPVRNIRPDENFAREVMQLFTVGLKHLNQDGTPLIDNDGEIIQTYWPRDVQHYAAALTGWYFADLEPFRFGDSFHSIEWSLRLAPMTAYDDYHQKTQKKLLRNYYIPAGATAEESLETVLDSLFYHPNLAPFVSLHLIKSFITSNPSPEYVARVSAVFNSNADGERGNLASVIQAVLFDREARLPLSQQPKHFGRVKDPLLKHVNYQRFFNPQTYAGSRLHLAFFRPSQQFLRSPSVFNFFSPTHTPNAAFAAENLVAPELEILTADTLIQDSSNFAYPSSLSQWEFNTPNASEEEKLTWVYYDFSPISNLISDEGLDAAITFTDSYLLQSRLTSNHRRALMDRFASEVDWIMEQDWNDPVEKQGWIDGLVARMIYALVSTPEYSVQR
jgi:uncharacterized protein (DUF1800 family)